MKNNDVVVDFDEKEEEEEGEEDEVNLVYQFLLETCKTSPTLKGNGFRECLRRANLLRRVYISSQCVVLWHFLRGFHICEVKLIFKIIFCVFFSLC